MWEFGGLLIIAIGTLRLCISDLLTCRCQQMLEFFRRVQLSTVAKQGSEWSSLDIVLPYFHVLFMWDVNEFVQICLRHQKTASSRQLTSVFGISVII